MDDIYNYLNDCLKKTFISHPLLTNGTYDDFLQTAIGSTMYDCNYKYKGKFEIRTNIELRDVIQLEPTIEAVFLYRLERELFLKSPSDPVLPYLASLMHRRTGCEIYYSTEIGKGFNIQHGFGTIIGPRYKIGDNFTIHQGVTLGQKKLNSPNEKMTIGNNVTVFANAIILGNLNIGNNASIGANSVLLCDAEEDSVYVGAPAKRVK